MYDFKKIEKIAGKVWKKHRKEIKNAVQDNPKKPLFSFLEGPPTANAPPGLHHLEVRTFKDIICKFRFMQGFSVPRKGGWDCHGLPVEVQVEKKLNLGHKQEVEKYGIDKFIKQCRKDVFSNIKEWNNSTEELNYWIDLENPYVTLENDYIESVWWSLKELHKKGLLYEGYKVVPFCPRCETPLSSHEVAQGYKNIREDSVYIAFKLKEPEKLKKSKDAGKGKSGNEYILAWTTTPWTLPGNVGLAVGPKIDYVKVELPDGDKLILGKEKLKLIKGDYKILEKMKGKELVGLKYEPLYDIPKTQNENSHKVVGADFVTTEDGTGVVHTAVMYGEDDYNLGKEVGFPEVHTVGEDGKFLDIAPDFIRGKFVKSVEKDIIEDLKKRHLLFKVEKFEHSYPFCWRCDSPLLYYGVNSWFVNVIKVRDKLIRLNKQINWYPSHIKDGRFGKWLDGAKDWSLSRFKFWGTPLPVWKNINPEKQDDIIVVGSKDELEKLSGKKLKDLHKPDIDKIKIEKNKQTYERVSDVIDCWYDSGSSSFAQFHYPFENKKEFEKRFPYDFISEAIDQTRGWFYTLHVLAGILFDKPAYKNCICAGHIVDKDGEKMSKSKGNIIKPNEIMEKTGVDAVRLQFCTSDAGNQKRFSYELMKESVIPFLTVLYNCDTYYRQLEKKKPKIKIEDKWILSRLNSVINEVTQGLENYQLNKPFESLMNFVVKDLSRGYIKMTRDREDTKEIIGEVMEKISLLLAPFAPYISEYIYENFSGKSESVHLSSWPKTDKKKINQELEAIFEQTLQLIEKGMSERDKAQIGLKWPLQKASIFLKGIERFEKVRGLIKRQLNVKGIEFKSPASKGTELVVELDTKLTPELESEGYARELSRQIQAFRKNLGLNKKDIIELKLIVDEELQKMLSSQENLLKNRTNSKSLELLKDSKENFKNVSDFKVKNKRGKIVIITTN